MNIMVAANSKYIPFCKVMLASLFEQDGDRDIHVYMPYDGLSDRELAELGNFIEGHEEKHFHPMQVDPEFKERVESHNGISIETYYRILAIDMLPDSVEKILYLDSDMVIQKSIASLWDTELKDRYFAVCEDIIGILNDFHEANKKRMNIPSVYSYFNAGVMLMNIAALKRDGICTKVLERIYTDFERYEYNDQDVLNEMFYDRLIYLPWQKYNCPPALYITDGRKIPGVGGEQGEVAHARNSEYDGEAAERHGEDAINSRFLSYSQVRALSGTAVNTAAGTVNVTAEVCAGAHIIHFLANTKPWSGDRRESQVYSIFDRVYFEARKRAGLEPDLPAVLREYLSANYTYVYLDGMLKASVLPEADTLILGSSYGLTDIDMSVLPTAVNLSVTSADLSAQLGILREAVEHRRAHFDRLVLLLGEYALYDDMSKSRMGQEIQRSVYGAVYGEWDPWSNVAVNTGLCIADRMKAEAAAKELIYSKGNFFNELYTREDNCEEKYRGLVWAEATGDERARFAGIRTADHNRLYKPDSPTPAKNRDCLDGIFSLAETYEMEVFVIFPPFSPEYEERIEPAMKAEMNAFLNETPHMVNLLDFRELVEDGTFTPEVFFDMDHLSAAGAVKFSGILRGLIHG
ncbi:MAG: glycosyltransferase family 8 protein [Lachnospiraceae bacterium]|nr:glycosyltransferase family 8 protein [Lachnospiraceae bacterium]